MADPDAAFLREAIALACESVKDGGGPFGCVIVRDGRVVARGHNQVTQTHDPTAHAEIVAIRAACQLLDRWLLDGCDLYTSCEPCPMCLGAAYWAHIDRLIFGASKIDAAAAGFDDAFIYEELDRQLADRRLHTVQLLPVESIEPFDLWRSKDDRVEY